VANLRNLEIVITRPLAQAEKWQQQLHAAGARTHLLPVLEIAPLTSPAEIQAVKARILSLADYQKVIFVSQNAVIEAVKWVDRYWPQLPLGIRYFAVGSSTAALAEAAELPVETAGLAMNSEALLELPALQAIKNEKILICRGAGGRTHLGEQLQQRGAQVDYCELYHRQLPSDAGQRFRDLLDGWKKVTNSGRQRVFAVHSGESLQNLRQLVDDIAPAWREAVLNATLLVPGVRVAALAAQLGFRRVLAAANATDEAMIQTLDGIEPSDQLPGH
jgi:uroporphyrinogen-III synthase